MASAPILTWTPYPAWSYLSSQKASVPLSSQKASVPWWSQTLAVGDYLTPQQVHPVQQHKDYSYATHIPRQASTSPVPYSYIEAAPYPTSRNPTTSTPCQVPLQQQRVLLNQADQAGRQLTRRHNLAKSPVAYPSMDPYTHEKNGMRDKDHQFQEETMDLSDEEEKTFSEKCCACFKHNIFLVFLLLGIGIGIGMGIGIRATYPEFGKDPRNVMYIEFPGKLLLRMLKMCIIPLIVSSLISGMASIPGKAAGRLGGFAVLYYMITTFMAVLLGILLVSTIRPGERGIDRSIKQNKDKLVEPVDALLDLVRNAFPDNIVGACFTQTRTIYDTIPVMFTKNNSWGNETVNGTLEEIDGFTITKESGTNVLGLVVFSIFIGVIVGRMGERGLPVKDFVDSFQEAIIGLVKIIIWYSPVGIAFLLAGRIIGMADPEQAFLQLAWYMMTVLVGLGFHGFVILPLIYVIFVRKNPFKHLFHMTQALLTALGTASSSATLPITMGCLEENAGVDRRVSRFMLPVGATINMDGTALYEAVASIFIAQVNNYDLDAGQLVTVSITATAAAIGAAGVPEAGLVTMVIVLTAIGLPTDEIGLIFAVDWFLDRFRTMINVWGDAVGAGVVEKLSGPQLRKMDHEEEAKKSAEDPINPGQLNPAYVYDQNNSNCSNL